MIITQMVNIMTFIMGEMFFKLAWKNGHGFLATLPVNAHIWQFSYSEWEDGVWRSVGNRIVPSISSVQAKHTDSGQNAQLFQCATATLLKREEKTTPTVLHRVFSISLYSRSTHLATSPWKSKSSCWICISPPIIVTHHWHYLAAQTILMENMLKERSRSHRLLLKYNTNTKIQHLLYMDHGWMKREGVKRWNLYRDYNVCVIKALCILIWSLLMNWACTSMS